MPERDARILIVDDEAVVRESLTSWLEDEGYTVASAANAKGALSRLQDERWDVILVDIKMPGMDGMELQRKINEIDPSMTVIIMTAYASVQTAVEALKAGAYDYIVKPFDPENLDHLIRNAAERKRLQTESTELQRKVKEEAEGLKIIGESPAMERVMELILQVARTDSTVLVRGESGTGKEVIARAIHLHSKRRYMPLVVVNCGALPEGILESELFGHEKGAFTGAQYRRKGKFEMADGGTIFLDEIGDIGPKTQSDLLRVLEEKKITRIGGNEEITLDFRVVAATNRNLEEAVAGGAFRQDLYYRLNVFAIALPPLRERPEDTLPLARFFLEKGNKAMGKRVRGFTAEAERLLLSYSWPGNVRELENIIERALIVCKGDVVKAECIQVVRDGDLPEDAMKSLSDVESEHVRQVLRATGWNVSRAAKILSIDRVTLYNKMKKYNLERPGDA